MNGIGYTIIGFILITLGTTLGSALVFLFKKISLKTRVIFNGFASGVMLSASIFSLLLPALNDQSNNYLPENLKWIIVVFGLILGFGFLYLLDKIIPHIHQDNNFEEGIKTNKISRNTKLFFAILLHNIPEGFSVGIAFGVAFSTNDLTSPLFLSGLMLSIGMALQNFPEGAAISLPLLEEGFSRKKAFAFGTLTGIVEPIAAIFGLLLATFVSEILPWALAFSAGCMIYVIIEELIPDSQNENTHHLGTWSFLIGFVIMMILDIALS